MKEETELKISKLNLEIDQVLKELKNEKIIETQEYFEKCSDLTEARKIYSNLEEKMLIAEVAKGNFYLSQNKKIIITDLVWFTNLMNILASSTTELSHSLQTFDYNIFKKDLNQKVTDNKLKLILDYITDLPWLKKLNDQIIIAFFQLPTKPLKNLGNLWPHEWSGAEHACIFKLFNPLNSQCFASMLKLFFHSKNTVLIWNQGILNRDSACDIHVENFNNSINLSVRVLDHDKQLNLKNTPGFEMARIIFMEYYLTIKVFLTIYNISYKMKTKDNIQAYNELAISDCEFYRNYLQLGHEFSQFDESFVSCINCLTSFNLFDLLSSNFNRLYSEMTTVKYCLAKGKICEIFGNMSNKEAFLIECNFNDVKPDNFIIDKIEINLWIYKAVGDLSVLKLDLIEKTFAIKGSELNILSTDLKKIEYSLDNSLIPRVATSSENYVVKSGDCLKIIVEKLDNSTSYVSIFYNLKRIFRFTSNENYSLSTKMKIRANHKISQNNSHVSQNEKLDEPFVLFTSKNFVS